MTGRIGNQTRKGKVEPADLSRLTAIPATNLECEVWFQHRSLPRESSFGLRAPPPSPAATDTSVGEEGRIPLVTIRHSFTAAHVLPRLMHPPAHQ